MEDDQTEEGGVDSSRKWIFGFRRGCLPFGQLCGNRLSLLGGSSNSNGTDCFALAFLFRLVFNL